MEVFRGSFTQQEPIPEEGIAAALAACGISFALLFTGLQLHWSWLLIRQVLKGLTKESDESSKGEVDLETYNLHVDEDDAERSRMLHPKTAL